MVYVTIKMWPLAFLPFHFKEVGDHDDDLGLCSNAILKRPKNWFESDLECRFRLVETVQNIRIKVIIVWASFQFQPYTSVII